MRTQKVVANGGLATTVLMLILASALSVHSQTVLIKMGDNQTYQGTNAPSPDIHGNYWNSVDSAQFSPGLTNIDGTVGGWPWWAPEFGFETNGVGNTGASNGPAGPVPPGLPVNCVIDANALGNLGIQQAVYDYYVNSEFELQGLYPSRTYTLTFFGSHSQSPSDYTIYNIYTNSSYTMLETAVAQYVQYPGNPSVPNSNMVVSATVLPGTNGIVYVQFLGTNAVGGGIGTNGAGGYLNCMQVTQGPSTNAPPPATPLNQTTLIQFGNSTLTNCTVGIVQVAGTNVVIYGNCPVTPNPDIQGHYWNSVTSSNIFPTINALGQVNSLGYSADAEGSGSNPQGGFDTYNGPDSGTNGITVTNIVSDVATNALGYLGVPTAVSTYFQDWQIFFDDLDPTHQYTFNFFGSMKYPASQITKFYVLNYAETSILGQFTSYVGSGQFNNEDRITSITLTPPADAALVFYFFGTNSLQTGCLNAMSIVDLTPYPAPTAPPVNATWLLNFGDANTYRGFNNPSPDTWGHYWNSLDTNYYANPVALTNAAGAATTMTVMFDTNAAYTNVNTGFGTDSYNSPCSWPAGGVPASATNAVINTNALGYLGVSPAVCQYYVNSHFFLQNMNPAHQYTLTFYGSHAYNGGTGGGPLTGEGDPLTVYNVYSDPGYSSLIASTKLCIGGAYFQDWNTHRLAVIGPIYPSGSGALYVDFTGSQGDLGYLNDMQIVDVTAANTPSDPFAAWQKSYFTSNELANAAYSGPNADPLGKGISNTNQFLAGFNPTNSAAYPHIISIAKSGTTNLTITYLGASGDSTWSPGFASRTNVLESTTGTANGSYSNSFVSTGQTNVLNGGSGLGTIASFIATNGVAGPTHYYRVRVLLP
ncbi:MAG TPA: hypothetical protein VMP11_13215 [Verrucomicrobiae bacterium]|nr:hypothetical protein [Verrucomicrobiae bacterium]